MAMVKVLIVSCVSYGFKVRQIRRALFTGRVSEVNVENIANVQGNFNLPLKEQLLTF